MLSRLAPALLTRLKTAAVWLMALGVLLLLSGWLFPELWRPTFAEQRPLAFVFFGTGALLMGLHTRREAERQREQALSSLTHNSLMPYEFAPVTLPMEEPPTPAQTQAFLDDAYPTLTPARPPSSTAERAPTSVPAPALAPAASRKPQIEPASAVTMAPPHSVVDITAPASPDRWSPGLLRALEWRRFEALCNEIFKQDGYVTKSSSPGADGSGWIWLHSRLDLHQPVRIVQCRNWAAEPVGVTAVREFLGAMVDAGLKSGALMTCGAFTTEAEALARRHSITLVNGPELLALINKRSEALQRELLADATQGDYGRPTCRRCGLKMVARSTHEDGVTHWACEGAPHCQGSLDWSAGPA